MKKWMEPRWIALQPPAPTKFLRLVLLAFAAAAGAAFLASLMANLSERRFRRKMMDCAAAMEESLPTLRRAAEITIAEQERRVSPSRISRKP